MAQQDTSAFHSLAGHFLIAMPGMPDPRFAKSVVFVWTHSPDAAMGVVINRLFGTVSFTDLLSQLNIEAEAPVADLPVHLGGPVEQGRGFVLHSTDVMRQESLNITGGIALTVSLDILRDIAGGSGPEKVLFALGYAGWGPGQLDQEMQNNGWLTAPADADILFDPDINTKWERAVRLIGIEPAMLSAEAGRA